ncbi:MAG: TetR family transcriptional regulator [Actinophytocola sp.]|uniref:TetR/AcrR family transcriptional regulator n=1 Tax=Actinophytocola sp. TaxID=1872138 RepID=UPI001323AA46|nr:TetR/AcrR family transcriptional regulator [Actinophytocola sp.]MPZ85259.1 TetR family transcriptional regulator [Actinophytocola sp.]
MEKSPASRRRPNARGHGELLREEILSAAARMLDELADDEALSLRAVARAVSIAATSVYLHFPDRDALVLAVLQRCHDELVQAGDDAEAAAEDTAAGLRARILAQADWAQRHPGLYKVMHESKVHRRLGMPFKKVLVARTTAAVQRSMDAGLAPPGDAATVAIDLRTAVNGMLSQRINEPDLPWPPADEMIDRFLTKLVGLAVPPDSADPSGATRAR